jgi:hypothetical protein
MQLHKLRKMLDEPQKCTASELVEKCVINRQIAQQETDGSEEIVASEAQRRNKETNRG